MPFCHIVLESPQGLFKIGIVLFSHKCICVFGLFQRKQSLPKRHKNEVNSLKEEFYTKQVPRESQCPKEESNSNVQNDTSFDKNTQHNTPSEFEDCRENKLRLKEKRQKRSRKKKKLDEEEVKRKRYKQERRLECDYCPEVRVYSSASLNL